MKDLFTLRRFSLFFTSLLALSLFTSSCNNDEEEAPLPEESVVEILAATEGLDSLGRLLTDPNFQQSFGTLRQELEQGDYTVFAPNNTAFRDFLLSIGLESMSDLRQDLLANIVNYHVAVNAALRSNQLDTAIVSILGEPINIQRGDSILLNPETQPDPTAVVTPDVLSQNGVIHVINRLLLPPGYAQDVVAPNLGTVAGLTATVGGLTNINSFFLQTGLLQNLGDASTDYTVLAPPDQVFQTAFFSQSETLQGVTSLHVLPGNVNLPQLGRTTTTIGNQTLYVTQSENTTFFNGIPAFEIDLVANNGRLLVLFGVLHEPRSLDETIIAAEANSNNTFDVFRKALETTNLDLGDNRTIFMPTDSAFARAGFGTVIDNVSRVDPAFLSTILQNHVVNGINFFPDLEEGPLQTLNGSITLETTDNGGINIADNNSDSENASILVGSDLLVEGNIVIHSIDQVLIP